MFFLVIGHSKRMSNASGSRPNIIYNILIRDDNKRHCPNVVSAALKLVHVGIHVVLIHRQWVIQWYGEKVVT